MLPCPASSVTSPGPVHPTSTRRPGCVTWKTVSQSVRQTDSRAIPSSGVTSALQTVQVSRGMQVRRAMQLPPRVKNCRIADWLEA